MNYRFMHAGEPLGPIRSTFVEAVADGIAAGERVDRFFAEWAPGGPPIARIAADCRVARLRGALA